MKDGLSVLAGTGMAGSSVLFLVSIELQHCHISGVLRILKHYLRGQSQRHHTVHQQSPGGERGGKRNR